MSVREREGRPNMNSYINLILDAAGAKERLQKWFQSTPEQSAADFPGVTVTSPLDPSPALAL